LLTIGYSDDLAKEMNYWLRNDWDKSSTKVLGDLRLGMIESAANSMLGFLLLGPLT